MSQDIKNLLKHFLIYSVVSVVVFLTMHSIKISTGFFAFTIVSLILPEMLRITHIRWFVKIICTIAIGVISTCLIYVYQQERIYTFLALYVLFIVIGVFTNWRSRKSKSE